MKTVKLMTVLMFIFTLMNSCIKDDIPEPEESMLKIKVDDTKGDIPSGEGETILGNELNNPYDLENINDAF